MPSIAEIYAISQEYLGRTPGTQALVAEYASEAATLPTVVNESLSIGIEIEVENVSPFIDNHGIWQVKPDGSLRNQGFEWVSWPIKGPAIVAALCDFFKLLSPTHHFSPRTSIHFHFDVSTLTPEKVTNIVLTYLAVEPLLYKFVGKDRDKNIYCVPMYETSLVDDLVEFLQKHMKRTPLSNSRYLGLNIAAVQKFGTLEFRHLGGTNKIKDILLWLNLLMRVYNYGAAANLGDLLNEIGQLNTNSYYIDFVRKVFGPQMDLLDLTDVKNDLEKGVKAVKLSNLNNKLLVQLKQDSDMDSPALRWYSKIGAASTIRSSEVLDALDYIKFVPDSATTGQSNEPQTFNYISSSVYRSETIPKPTKLKVRNPR